MDILGVRLSIRLSNSGRIRKRSGGMDHGAAIWGFCRGGENRDRIPETMTVLSSKKILEQNNTTDLSSIVSLSLTHKALYDVSCLGDFKNLEKLDLGFNNLTSLEGLKSCVNLKWLSVANNKIQSLRGIEGLSKLTVLNAGKNKLNSMNEVQYLTSLRALILNDNEITSVCKLHQMKELNTLVLSRNPIGSLGESLAKLKSITKLSLSNCKLHSVNSSLKSCLGLKELRLAHNEIVSIPIEFGHLSKLQNLDMGNNFISNWANLKVLSSLVNLKNLNLQGNPIAEKEHLLKKVKRLLPNLHIFNARPIDKISEKELRDKAADVSVEAGDKFNLQSEVKIDQSVRIKNSSATESLNGIMGDQRTDAENLGSRKKRKELHGEKGEDSADEANISEKKMKKKLKLRLDLPKEADTGKLEKHRIELPKEPNHQLNGDATKEHHKKLRKKHDKVQENIIDCADTPFTDLFASVSPQLSLESLEEKLDHKTDHNIKSVGGLGANPSKKKKRNHSVSAAAIEFLQSDEIGVGGPSTWDDL